MSSHLHPAQLPIDRLLVDCDIAHVRRSGPGGQHRNKVQTGIVLTHRPTGIRGEASERRSQVQNKSQAIHRLRVNLAIDVRCPRIVADAPGPLWQQRCVSRRIVVNQEHEDYPALLAEAVEIAVASGGDLKQAAALLGCSTTQLTRFLKAESRAYALIAAPMS